MWKFTKRQIVLLVVLGLLMPAAATVVFADLKTTAVVYAWDIAALKYQNSNVVVNFDGSWVPFWHQLNFDGDPFSSTDPDLADTCVATSSTPWAGIMYYGLYHEDNSPAGGLGFQETRNWQLVDCDRTGDGNFNNADLSFQPPTARTLYISGTPDSTCYAGSDGVCRLLSKDEVTGCTSGNCALEIVTRFFINLDPGCDGLIDIPLPAAGLCFFAEARTPPPPYYGTHWSGPLQARIAAGGGEKTVNFSPQPTAANLSSFQATAGGGAILLEWQTAGEVDLRGFNLWRSLDPAGHGVKLNEAVIQPLSPGSLLGNSYSYRDDTVAAGTAYYYWLEALEVGGASTWYGPLAALLEVDPTAVRLLNFVASRPVTTLGGTLLLALGATGLVLVWRRRRP